MTRNTHREQTTAGTNFGLDKPTTQKQREMYLKGLPKDLRHWLLYDAMCDYSVRRIYSIYRKIGDTSETIRFIKEMELEQTIKAYGPNHPAAIAERV